MQARTQRVGGLPVPVAVGLYRWAKTRPHLRPRGITVHLGSEIVDPAPYKQALRQLMEVVHLLKKEDILLDYVDIGGGFGIGGCDACGDPFMCSLHEFEFLRGQALSQAFADHVAEGVTDAVYEMVQQGVMS